MCSLQDWYHSVPPTATPHHIVQLSGSRHSARPRREAHRPWRLVSTNIYNAARTGPPTTTGSQTHIHPGLTPSFSHQDTVFPTNPSDSTSRQPLLLVPDPQLPSLPLLISLELVCEPCSRSSMPALRLWDCCWLCSRFKPELKRHPKEEKLIKQTQTRGPHMERHRCFIFDT